MDDPARLAEAAPNPTVRRWGLALGPALALLAFALAGGDGPAALSPAGRVVIGVATLMAVWWLTEALPLAATALLPIALFPLLGVAPVGEVTRAYGNDVIFLFMGGFVLGLAMERWSLHRRIALAIVLRAGTRPAQLVGALLLSSAALSLWISNTATSVILQPIGLSIVALAFAPAAALDAAQRRRFAVCVVLAVAWGASIGGSGTLIGSPPNLVLAGYARQQLGCDIGMLDWMRFGIPFVILFLPLAWLLLTHVLFPLPDVPLAGSREEIAGALRALGRPGLAERWVMAVFALAVLAWVFRPWLARATGLDGLSDTGIAIGVALLLFLLPAGTAPGARVMDWQTAARLPWGVLLLFGGGLALGQGLSATGVDRSLATTLSGLGEAPPWLLLLLITALAVFLSELASNTAVATTFVPLLGGIAGGLGLDAVPALVAATLGASCGFMLPAATPPNAIAYASGYVTIGQMARAGFALNLVGIALTMAVAMTLTGALCR